MTSDTDPSSKQKNKAPFQEDLSLVQAISAGSVSAWHNFIHRYSGLIYSVVRRHLLTDDEDEIRSVYVDILKDLYEGELAKYRGEARLSTWLIVSVRSRAIDVSRKRFGRIRASEGYDELSEFDKKVLQLFYIERLPLEIVVSTLGWKDSSTNVDGVVESIQRIESKMGQRYFKKLDHEYQAKKFGTGSIQMLRYLIQQRLEFEERSSTMQADHSLMEKEVLDAANRLREMVSALSPEERSIVFLRFDRGLSAGDIADRLGLKSQRHVYGLIDTVIRKLREAMMTGKD